LPSPRFRSRGHNSLLHCGISVVLTARFSLLGVMTQKAQVEHIMSAPPRESGRCRALPRPRRAPDWRGSPMSTYPNSGQTAAFPAIPDSATPRSLGSFRAPGRSLYNASATGGRSSCELNGAGSAHGRRWKPIHIRSFARACTLGRNS
jgi:hypothetical protein